MFVGQSNKENGPGPAAYSPELKRKDGFSFGGRPQLYDDDKSPGPAAYNPRLSRKNGISIGGRPQDNLEDVGPGPAQYYPGLGDSTKRALPAWSFGGRHRAAETDDIPGPGEPSQF